MTVSNFFAQARARAVCPGWKARARGRRFRGTPVTDVLPSGSRRDERRRRAPLRAVAGRPVTRAHGATHDFVGGCVCEAPPLNNSLQLCIVDVTVACSQVK